MALKLFNSFSNNLRKLSIFTIIVLFSVFQFISFGQTKRINKSYLIEWKEKYPFVNDLNCFTEPVYVYDSILIVKAGYSEGCDTGVVYGLNNNSGKVLWSFSGIGYSSTKFNEEDFFYFNSGKLFCKAISTGETLWTVLIDNKSTYANIGLITSNRIYLTISEKVGTTNLYDHTLAIVDKKNKTVIQNIICRNTYPAMSSERIIKNFLYLNSYPQYYLFELSDVGDPINLNIQNGSGIISLSDKFSVLEIGEQSSDKIYLINSITHSNPMTTTDSIFDYSLKTGSLTLKYTNKRERIIWGSGFNNYPKFNEQKSFAYLQLDSINESLYYTKQTLVMVNKKNAEVIWKYSLPVKYSNRKMSNNDIRIITEKDITYLLFDNTIYCFSNETGNMYWKFKNGDGLINIHSLSNQLIITSITKQREKHTCLVFNKHNFNQKPIELNYRLLLVDENSERLYVEDSNGNVLKVRLL